MIFRHFLLDTNESNSFVVGCEDTREAMLIDVGEFDPAIVDFIEEHKLRLTTIFITHDHYDHTAGLGEAVAQFGAQVLAAKDRVGGQRARKVSHGDKVHIGSLEATVLSTPGHTQDSISLAFPGVVFSGDALFSGSVGGTSSPQCAKQELDHIRKSIFSLPDDYEIHTGHGPSSTVAIERQHNPFFN